MLVIRIIFFSFFLSVCLPVDGQHNCFKCESQLVKSSFFNGLSVATSPARASTGDFMWGLATISAVGISMTADESLQQWISSGRSDNLNHVARVLGEPFGNPYYVGGATLLSYALACHLGNEPLQKVSSEAFQSVVIASGVTLFLKAAFHRQRPDEQSELNPYVFDGPSLERGHMSFPSGHTTVAFGLATSLSLSLDSWYYSVPLYGLATLTAWERIYNFKHWPSDVLLGAAIGSTVGWLVHRYENPKIELVMSGNRWGGSNIGLGISLN